MNYGKRINLLCSLLQPSATFADVGCDHGYCSQYVLEKGLCEKVFVSDVSKGSLKKAEDLLSSYLQAGRVTSVLGDGFYGIPKDTEQVLIAGMGGQEILKILSHPKYGFIPAKFVFQPMHDTAKLRKFLLEQGAYIERDFTFVDGRKYYDVLTGRKAKQGEEQSYTPAQLAFGKENVLARTADFLSWLKKEIEKIDGYIAAPSLSEESRVQLESRRALMEGVVKDEIK